jgi:hypothetical protein
MNRSFVRWLDGKEVCYPNLVLFCDRVTLHNRRPLFSFHSSSSLLLPAIFRMLNLGCSPLSAVGEHADLNIRKDSYLGPSEQNVSLSQRQSITEHLPIDAVCVLKRIAPAAWEHWSRTGRIVTRKSRGQKQRCECSRYR